MFEDAGALGRYLGLPDLKWADERQWCKHVHAALRAGSRAVRPAGCPNLVDGGGNSPLGRKHGRPEGRYPEGACALNGRRQPTPCAFDDPGFDWSKAARWQKGNVPFECLNSEQI